MFNSTYCLLKFFDTVEKVNGRKKLQKMIHLLENSGEDFPFKYEYHFYGPYSAQLQEEVITLVQQGFLTESNEDDTYIYQITDKGKKFKSNLEGSGNFKLILNEELLSLLSQESSQFLEMVSTYSFLIESGYSLDLAKQKAEELKPHLEGYIDRAVTFYSSNILKKPIHL